MDKFTPLKAGTPSSPSRYVLCTFTSLITSLEWSLFSSSLSSYSSSLYSSPALSAPSKVWILSGPTYKANGSLTPIYYLTSSISHPVKRYFWNLTNYLRILTHSYWHFIWTFFGFDFNWIFCFYETLDKINEEYYQNHKSLLAYRC